MIYSFNNSVSSVLSAIEIWAMRILREFKMKSLEDSFCWRGPRFTPTKGFNAIEFAELLREIYEFYSEVMLGPVAGTIDGSCPILANYSCFNIAESYASKIFNFCLFPFSPFSAFSWRASWFLSSAPFLPYFPGRMTTSGIISYSLLICFLVGLKSHFRLGI